MPGVGPGVREIRIHTALEHRVLYLAKFEEAVYVITRLREADQDNGEA